MLWLLSAGIFMIQLTFSHACITVLFLCSPFPLPWTSQMWHCNSVGKHPVGKWCANPARSHVEGSLKPAWRPNAVVMTWCSYSASRMDFFFNTLFLSPVLPNAEAVSRFPYAASWSLETSKVGVREPWEYSTLPAISSLNICNFCHKKFTSSRSQ